MNRINERGLLSILLIIGVILLIFGAFILVATKINPSNTQIATQSKPSQETYKSKKIGRYQQEVLYSEPWSMKVIDLEGGWTDGNVKVTILKAYLTPYTVYNFFPRNVLEGSKAENFLIIEADIRDLRTVGNPRDIAGENYFRLRKNTRDTSPLDGSAVFKPQENKQVNTVFNIEKDDSKFVVIAGPLAKPRVINLDFMSSEAKEVTGFYDWPIGFSETLKLD